MSRSAAREETRAAAGMERNRTPAPARTRAVPWEFGGQLTGALKGARMPA